MKINGILKFGDKPGGCGIGSLDTKESIEFTGLFISRLFYSAEVCTESMNLPVGDNDGHTGSTMSLCYRLSHLQNYEHACNE